MKALQDRWESFFFFFFLNLNKASKEPFTEGEIKKQPEFFEAD